MTLTIHTQEDEQRQLLVTIEVPEDRVQTAMRQAARVIARRTRIPGFRPGKAPYGVILSLVGEEALREDGIQEMAQTIFQEAIRQLDVEPYAQPILEDVQYTPALLKVLVPLEPVVVLGDYRAVRRELVEPTISDEAVDEALEHLRSHHAVVEPVDRPVEVGDQVTISGQGTFGDDEEPFFNEERLDLTVSEDAVFENTDFAEQLLGLSAGDEKTFSVTFPDSYDVEDWGGKSAEFTITVLEVKSRQLPPLDDELAKLEGDYETLDELRAATREDLARQAQQQFINDVREEWIRDLLDGVEELAYPPGAVAEELNTLIENYKNQVRMIGLEWDQFLQMQGRTEDDYREDMEEAAVESLERRLVMQKFMVSERLTVDDADFNAGIDKYLSRYGDNDDVKKVMRNYLLEQGGTMILNEVLLDKAHARITAILSGNAPELTDEVEDAADDAADAVADAVADTAEETDSAEPVTDSTK